MSSSLKNLIGSEFGRHEEKEDGKTEWITLQLTVDQLASTTVGLYFANMQSAKSKEFTKVLLQFYEQMKKSSSSTLPSSSPASSSSLSSSSPTAPSNSNFPSPPFSSTFTVIIVSFDETEKIVHLDSTSTPFLHFSGEGARVRQEYLIRKYGVNETPKLILMDGTSGHVINFHGKEKMLEDPTASKFPWRHSSCTDILGSSRLITSASATGGNAVQGTRTQGLLKESVKGLLFAAYWYPPCRGFITSLIDVYNKVRERGNKFEIVFITSDRSQESFDRFFSQMPWLGIAYEDEKGRAELTALLNIKAIPTLVIMDAEDNIITAEGRLEVNDDLDGFDFPWYPKLVEELRDRHSSVLNSSLSLIYFIGDEDGDEYDKAEGTLLPIASQIITESQIEEPFRPKFFIGTDSELSEALRLFVDLDDTKSLILILDIPNYRYALLQEGIEDEKCVTDFLHKFQNAQLPYKYIQSRFI